MESVSATIRKQLLSLPTRRVLGEVGRCIYCDRIPEPPDQLSAEHIIAHGLGGRDELHKASCRSCAAVTSALEARVLRSSAWGPLRSAIDLKSRKKRKRQQLFTVKHVGAARPKHMVAPIENFPLAVPFFQYGSPGLLDGSTPAESISGGLVLWTPRKLTNTVPIEIPIELHSDDIARLLAKIALGYAVAKHPLDNFEEVYVRELILGNLHGVNLWVGCRAKAPTFAEQRIHSALVEEVDGHVAVSIQLFRAPQSLPQRPVYQVLVGRLKARAIP